ncbi:unnamed protein product [Cunninghamella blakesleeana]
MRKTVDLLQHTIQQLEVELNDFKNQNNSYTNNSNTTIKYGNTIFNHHQQQQKNDLILSQPSYPLLPASLDRSVYLENDMYMVATPESGSDYSSNSCCSHDDGLFYDKMEEDDNHSQSYSHHQNSKHNQQLVTYNSNQQMNNSNSNSNNNNNNNEKKEHNHNNRNNTNNTNTQSLFTMGKEWKISIVNGKWRIDTDIQNISQLQFLHSLAYGNTLPSLHDSDRRFIVESCDPRSVFPFTIKIARSNLLNQTTLLLQQQLISYHSIPEPILSLDPKSITDQLIYRYFALYNPSMTFLYEPTFMTHYQQLKNPFTCSITMAICTLVCCAHTVPSTPQRDILGNKLIYNPTWFLNMYYRRSLGEFFYRKCRNVLDEIIHDPKRQLDTLITITLLKRFLMNTLRLSEMRNLETIAYFLCLEIKPLYENPHTCTIVERALFARHYSFTIWCYIMVDFFSSECRSNHEPGDYMYMEVLPGESELTRQFFLNQNYYLDIFLHPTVQYTFKHIKNVLMGQSQEITLELIISFEDVTIKWWKSLPDELRLCDEPYDFEAVSKAIDETDDSNKLSLFLCFLDLIFNFHSCLQKIRPTTDYCKLNSNIINLIQEKSIKACLDYSEILIHAVNKMDPDIAYSQYLSDIYIFIAVDVLAGLAFSENETVSKKAKQKLKKCLMALETADFMTGQRIPKELSPLYNNVPFTSKSSFFKLYHEYPQPRYALLYDICRYLSP